MHYTTQHRGEQKKGDKIPIGPDIPRQLQEQQLSSLNGNGSNGLGKALGTGTPDQGDLQRKLKKKFEDPDLLSALCKWNYEQGYGFRVY